MAETSVSNPSTTPSKTKAKASSAKKPKLASTHPPVAEMVVAAINNLKDRSGSSSQAIKKYIASNYKVEVERLTPFIKKYLKSGVANGTLQQTKGKGASGSFKIAANSKPKTTTAAKKTKPVKAKKSAANPAGGDNPRAKKAVITPKKAKPVKKAKTPKPKKAAKVEKKAKAPKATKSPKKVLAPKPKAVKKSTKKAPSAKKSPKKA